MSKIVLTDKYRVVVSGRQAMFTDPYMRTDKRSYPVPTRAAQRAIIEALYWHPGITVVPTKVIVLEKPAYHTVLMTRRKGNKYERSMMYDTYITNPHYVFEWLYRVDLSVWERDIRDGRDPVKKIHSIVTGRIDNGKYHRKAYFGGYHINRLVSFAPYRNESPVDYNIKIRGMYIDRDYNNKGRGVFADVDVVDGVITWEGV